MRTFALMRHTSYNKDTGDAFFGKNIKSFLMSLPNILPATLGCQVAKIIYGCTYSEKSVRERERRRVLQTVRFLISCFGQGYTACEDFSAGDDLDDVTNAIKDLINYLKTCDENECRIAVTNEDFIRALTFLSKINFIADLNRLKKYYCTVFVLQIGDDGIPIYKGVIYLEDGKTISSIDDVHNITEAAGVEPSVAEIASWGAPPVVVAATAEAYSR